MSSGPSALKVNPRAGSSICIEESPRSASRTSAPPGASASTNGARPAKFIRRTHDRLGGEAEAPEPGLGPGQFDRVGVDADQPAAGLDGGEKFPGVAAVPERAVDGDLARPRREYVEDLADHDRPVRARRASCPPARTLATSSA